MFLQQKNWGGDCVAVELRGCVICCRAVNEPELTGNRDAMAEKTVKTEAHWIQELNPGP
jgi:hypothetical protein